MEAKWWWRIHWSRWLWIFSPIACLVSSRGFRTSLFRFHIVCFKSSSGIYQPFWIHKTIVIDLNFTVSLIRLPYTFSWYSKLSHVPTSWQLLAYCLIHFLFIKVILQSLLCRNLYETERPRWLRSVIISTLAPAEYMYKAMRRRK